MNIILNAIAKGHDYAQKGLNYAYNIGRYLRLFQSSTYKPPDISHQQNIDKLFKQKVNDEVIDSILMTAHKDKSDVLELINNQINQMIPEDSKANGAKSDQLIGMFQNEINKRKESLNEKLETHLVELMEKLLRLIDLMPPSQSNKIGLIDFWSKEKKKLKGNIDRIQVNLDECLKKGATITLTELEASEWSELFYSLTQRFCNIKIKKRLRNVLTTNGVQLKLPKVKEPPYAKNKRPSQKKPLDIWVNEKADEIDIRQKIITQIKIVDGKPTVTGNLDLRGYTGLTSLPKGLGVGGDLDLSGCTGLTSLPESVSVGGNITYPDGRTYVGQFQNGKPHGKGKMTYPDGKIFEGNFEDGDFRVSKEQLNKIIEELTCPCSHDTLDVPVTLITGHTYTENSINNWLNEQPTCPMTRKIVDKIFYTYNPLNELVKAVKEESPDRKRIAELIDAFPKNPVIVIQTEQKTDGTQSREISRIPESSGSKNEVSFILLKNLKKILSD